MSYSMHSPTQGYTNPTTDVYNSRAYTSHLMGPSTMNNFSPGYLREDPYNGNSNSLQYANGVGLQTGSHYSGNSSSISHHTYPSSINHFGHQQDVYNSCVGPLRNTSYPPPSNAPNLTSSVSRHSINSKSYWNCDPVSQPTPNHCYPSNNSTHKTTPQNWSRSPNVISSPSSTPSPIPCPSTPHPFHGSSPHHHSDTNKPFNGQIISSHSSLNSTTNQSGAINCNSNPLQSLQKMVQIDSDGSDLRAQYEPNSSSVPIINQHPSMNTQQQQQQQPHTSRPLGSLENETNNYPTYYNLDQNRLCATPQSTYPNLSTQSSSVPFSPISKSSHSPEARSQSLASKQEKQNDSSDINNLTRTNSIRFSTKISKNNGSCSTETTRSNESPTAQSSNKVSTVPESIIHADQTHDSMNSFRGSETTANSRDSVKSSDSDAVSSYTVSQCPTPNNTWKINNANVQANQPNEFRGSNFSSNSQTKWWSENSLPTSSTTNRSFTPQAIAECNQYNTGNVTYPMTRLSQSNANQSWSQQVVSVMSNQSSVSHQLLGNLSYASQPDGVVKKKRGRPFGSKNRRSLEPSTQIMYPNKKKRKSILIDIGINTNLSFDVQASWNHDDSITFSEPLTVQHPLPLATRRKKIVGPVIRIDKSCFETNNAKYSIVNNSLKIHDDDREAKSTKSHSNKISNEIGGKNHSRKNNFSKKSFLSSNHTNNTERNWFCILCHKGPHHKGLGDLYGPYFISFENSKILFDLENESQTANDDTREEIEPAHESHMTTERRSLRKRPESLTDEIKSRNNSMTNHFDYKETTNKTELEVWIHEDCIVWSNNVYLEGTKIRNLEPAIVESFENICTKCKLPGATLGCIYKNCTVSPLHYLCAKEKDCDLDEEKFILSCSKHKKRRIMRKENEVTRAEVPDDQNEIVNDEHT